MMINLHYRVKLISNFTLALLQDSGWYQVDFNVTGMWRQPSKFKGMEPNNIPYINSF